MIQAAKLTEIPGTARTYSAEIIHVRILASSTGEEDAGAATLATGERTVAVARGALDVGDLLRLPDDEVYRCSNVEGLPPFFHTFEASLERQSGVFVTQPFRLSRLTDGLGNFLTDSSGNRLAGW